jgi:hypothetical protein
VLFFVLVLLSCLCVVLCSCVVVLSCLVLTDLVILSCLVVSSIMGGFASLMKGQEVDSVQRDIKTAQEILEHMNPLQIRSLVQLRETISVVHPKLGVVPLENIPDLTPELVRCHVLNSREPDGCRPFSNIIPLFLLISFYTGAPSPSCG